MSKTKQYLMEQEDKFYIEANELVKASEYEAEAVNKVVVLADEMNLLDYLGSYTAVESIVEDAWYDINYKHIG